MTAGRSSRPSPSASHDSRVRHRRWALDDRSSSVPARSAGAGYRRSRTTGIHNTNPRISDSMNGISDSEWIRAIVSELRHDRSEMIRMMFSVPYCSFGSNCRMDCWRSNAPRMKSDLTSLIISGRGDASDLRPKIYRMSKAALVRGAFAIQCTFSVRPVISAVSRCSHCIQSSPVPHSKVWYRGEK